MSSVLMQRVYINYSLHIKYASSMFTRFLVFSNLTDDNHHLDNRPASIPVGYLFSLLISKPITVAMSHFRPRP